MHRYEFLLSDISCCDIRHLDHDDDSDPYTEPDRNMHYRQKFDQAYRYEYDICNRIQLCAKLADGTCFPRHSTIDHV